MRRILAAEMTNGMRLARPIFGPRGSIMLARGTILTPSYVARIRSMEVVTLYIDDASSSNIEADDLVSDQVRQACVERLALLMENITRNIDSSKNKQGSTDPSLPSLTRIMNPAQIAKLLKDLRLDVNAILREALNADVVSGISAIRARDTALFNHAIDVCALSLVLGKNLYIAEERLIDLAMGALLHDIGKLLLDPDLRTFSYTELNDEQRIRYQAHTSLGFQLLQQLNPDHLIANHVAWQHHERFDGQGWPRGLRGDAALRPTPVRAAYAGYSQEYLLDIAEIVTVANTYDILAAGAPGSPPEAPDQVVLHLRSMAGHILNPKVVRTLLGIIPVFPIGTEVVVRTGQYRGYVGIVSHVDVDMPNRPTIRMIQTPAATPCPPIELALRDHPEIDLRAHLTIAATPIRSAAVAYPWMKTNDLPEAAGR